MLEYPAYKNGKYCRVKDLTVSILDFGFIHSDATYDVMSVHDGEVKDFDAHIARFMDNCNYWGLNTPNDFHIKEIIETLIQQSPSKNLLVWVCVTRGTPTTGNPRDLGSCNQNFFAYTKPYYGFNATNSATVCVAKQRRNTAIDQRRKNLAWSDLTLAQMEANNRGFDTAILLDERGYVTEGPGFNIGIIIDQNVYTPRRNCLRGITMDRIKRFLGETEFRYMDITPHFVEAADAVFLTSTAGDIITVTKFEDKILPDNEMLKWLQKHI
jgi:branched-chain amino acid aminotransferase